MVLSIMVGVQPPTSRRSGTKRDVRPRTPGRRSHSAVRTQVRGESPAGAGLIEARWLPRRAPDVWPFLVHPPPDWLISARWARGHRCVTRAIYLRRPTLGECQCGATVSGRHPTYHRFPCSPTISRCAHGVERRSGPTTSSAGQEHGNRTTSLAQRRERNTKASWRKCAHRIDVAFPHVSCVPLSHSDTVSAYSKENSHNGPHDRPAGPARAPGSDLGLLRVFGITSLMTGVKPQVGTPP